MRVFNRNNSWTQVIEPGKGTFGLNFQGLWQYRDLFLLFIRRDIVSVYKQTVLGPLWFIIPPILMTVIQYLVFNLFAGLPTDNAPGFLFYLAGNVAWAYFADNLSKTSVTFVANAQIFGKVYFPRLIIPISVVCAGLVKFGVQFVLFLAFLLYYVFATDLVSPNFYIFLVPYLLLLMAAMGLGFGILISSLTTKYRDLSFLVSFGVQLFMYITPVIYPLSLIPEKYRIFVIVNPMTSVIETFRYAFLGTGSINIFHLMYTTAFTIIVLIIGLFLFGRTERTFMDTV